MDLFDLTRLLFRRWYVALPLLLVSLTGVLMLSRTVEPDYSAEGHLQLIPASGSADDATTTTGGKPKPARVHNPWGDLGFNALGQAAIVKVEDESVAKGLTSAGLSDSFTVTIEYGTTFLSIEAIGTSAAQATASVQRLMTVLAQFVEAEQSRFGVAKADMITTLALDHGEKVTVVTSKQRRVLIVSAGIGVLVTAAATIGIDALLRRRTQRRSAQEGKTPEIKAKSPPTPVEDSEATRRIDLPPRPGIVTGTGTGIRPVSSPLRAVPSASSEATQTIIPSSTVLRPRGAAKRAEGKVFRSGANGDTPATNGETPAVSPGVGQPRDDKSR